MVGLPGVRRVLGVARGGRAGPLGGGPDRSRAPRALCRCGMIAHHVGLGRMERDRSHTRFGTSRGPGPKTCPHKHQSTIEIVRFGQFNVPSYLIVSTISDFLGDNVRKVGELRARLEWAEDWLLGEPMHGAIECN